MARAWPQIRSLKLRSYFSRPVRPRATIQCLQSFAQYSPHLERLEISFDASTIPFPHDGTRPSSPSSSVSSICMRHVVL
ncbi:hypothetical protein C8R44DRAFT_768808 [Mycena epipterygia]|nr:hypothetical protein C8R44DRAFT_768808 [Mycena epipterygia]